MSSNIQYMIQALRSSSSPQLLPNHLYLPTQYPCQFVEMLCRSILKAASLIFLACSASVNASPVEEANADLVQENGWEGSPIGFEISC